MSAPIRVLLLIPTSSYKVREFMAAATRMNIEVVIGTERRQALETTLPGHTLTLDLRSPERSLGRIHDHAAECGLDAVVGTDDETVVLAAMAAERLGLRHNPVEAVRLTRDKYAMRSRFAAAGMHGPGFARVELDDDPRTLAGAADYPCVLKPLFLSASRGVIRADDEVEFVAAFERIVDILDEGDVRIREGDARHLIVEQFLPGPELAVEALLDDGQLHVLALFDKPDPLDGPTFEETLYVTPSRLPAETVRTVVAETERGCRALGLREGPVHAELRLHDGAPWILEIAARTIGGNCSRALRFGAGISLEERVLRHALGTKLEPPVATGASGVMMIPVPGSGVLDAVRGLDAASEVAGIDRIEITAHRGAQIVPPPEGHRYLGFIFARGDTAGEVEAALRDAHRRLEFELV